MKEKKERAKRLPTFAESITPIVAMLLILTIGKGVFGYSTEPLLIMVAAIAAFIAFRVGITWDEMMDEICTKIAKGMPAILILVCVGAMVGTWMASGTIPMMIYYGVQIVNPKFMLVTAFLIEAVVSVVTGTSWGSVATMGVALMGIASALGVSFRLLQAPASQVPTLVTRCLRCPIPQTWLRSRQAAHCMSISDICSTPLSQQPSFPGGICHCWYERRCKRRYYF